MAFDLDRSIRKVESITGCTITIVDARTLSAADPELDIVHVHSEASGRNRIDRLHRKIYNARRMEIFRRQEGRCAQCGGLFPLDCHHKVHRGAHGRNDRMENMEGVCAAFFGCQYHRKQHGG